jgi:hypothetical protein
LRFAEDDVEGKVGETGDVSVMGLIELVEEVKGREEIDEEIERLRERERA